MIFLILIFILLFMLVFVSISNTLIGFALKLITGKNYDERKLILPSFINFILFSIFIVTVYLILMQVSINGVWTTLISLIFRATSLSSLFTKVILPIITLFVVCLILESFSLLTVDLNYAKLTLWFNNLWHKVKNKLKFKKNNNVDTGTDDLILDTSHDYRDSALNNDFNILDNGENLKDVYKDGIISNNILKDETSLVISDKKEKLKYINSLVATIFILSLIIFFFTVLFSIGFFLSRKII